MGAGGSSSSSCSTCFYQGKCYLSSKVSQQQCLSYGGKWGGGVSASVRRAALPRVIWLPFTASQFLVLERAPALRRTHADPGNVAEREVHRRRASLAPHVLLPPAARQAPACSDTAGFTLMGMTCTIAKGRSLCTKVAAVKANCAKTCGTCGGGTVVRRAALPRVIWLPLTASQFLVLEH